MRIVYALIFAITFPIFSFPTNSVKSLKEIQKTTHKIHMSTVFGGAGCSATAIGKHALLTASHCELPTDQIEIDPDNNGIFSSLFGNDEGPVITIVGTPIRDGFDHSILLLKGVEFKDIASFSNESLEVGDEVMYFGNPAGIPSIFRKGTVVSIGPERTLYDINGFYGDSGSAIFNMSGYISGVVSFGSITQSKTDTFKLMGSFPLSFTKEQIKEALSF